MNINVNIQTITNQVNEATFGVPEVVEAWNYYHGLLEEARQNQTTQALVLDIHGHGHAVDWAELGYLVAGYNLDSGNVFLLDFISVWEI